MDNLSPSRSGVPAEPGVWGVRPGALAFAGAALAGGILWALLVSSPVDRSVAVALSIAGLLALVAGWRMRRRLVAGPDGFTVSAPLSSRRVSWPSVVSVEVVRRQRFGIASTTLEIDLDDEGLFVLGRLDLGVDPVEVARQLRVWWVAVRGES